jgi:hypothetical protein
MSLPLWTDVMASNCMQAAVLRVPVPAEDTIACVGNLIPLMALRDQGCQTWNVPIVQEIQCLRNNN